VDTQGTNIPGNYNVGAVFEEERTTGSSKESTWWDVYNDEVEKADTERIRIGEKISTAF